MIIDLETIEITRWSVAALVASSLTLFLTILYLFINSSYKRKSITRSAFISALFSLISMAIIFANENSSRINLSALFVIRGIQYAFAFHTMLYAFYRNIVRVNGEDKYLVNIGYIWMFVTLGVSLAATLMTNNISWRFYDIRDFKNIYNVVAVTMLSSWGFIAIIILLYIKNRQHFSVDSETTVIIYIFLVLIQTITTTVTMYRYAGNDDIRSAFDFFLIDLPMDIAIIIAAHRGPVWIGDANINSKSGDLEVNHGSN